MDADNVARPHMIERFVSAMRRNPDLAALTCFCLAFEDESDLQNQEFQYAYRPTGGPHMLASIKNVYGDANALFRTDLFRAAGGYETDRDSSWEDLEAFVKLVNAGYRLDTLPEYLFYYRHLETGFSRVTDTYLNQRRVLRQYFQIENLPLAESMALWTALVSLHKRNEALALRLTSLRYRFADCLHALFACVPGVKRGLKWLLQSSGAAWGCLRAAVCGWKVVGESKRNEPSSRSKLTGDVGFRSIPPALAGSSANGDLQTISGKDSGT